LKCNGTEWFTAVAFVATAAMPPEAAAPAALGIAPGTAIDSSSMVRTHQFRAHEIDGQLQVVRRNTVEKLKDRTHFLKLCELGTLDASRLAKAPDPGSPGSIRR
jgi:hypothetical protein